jgi:hypothetical protein
VSATATIDSLVSASQEVVGKRSRRGTGILRHQDALTCLGIKRKHGCPHEPGAVDGAI